MLYHEDDILLKRLRSGDEKAFADIFKKYSRYLATEASYHLDDKAAASDLVQNLFFTWWKNRTLHTLELRVSLRTYLAQSIRQNCLKYNIRNKKASLFVELQERMVEREQVYEYSIDSELGDRIKKMIDALPLASKVALTEVYLKELDRKEILNKLGITSKTLSNNLSMGLTKLRHLLENSL